MVMEMLLNNDFKKNKMILHFQKEINVIMHIIEKKLILIISFRHNFNKL